LSIANVWEKSKRVSEEEENNGKTLAENACPQTRRRLRSELVGANG
jgi:hypothetical protein